VVLVEQQKISPTIRVLLPRTPGLEKRQKEIKSLVDSMYGQNKFPHQSCER
jgi:hypothetical protein